MEMAPQAIGRIGSGDGNGAVGGLRTPNEWGCRIEATKGQVLAPNALKKLARGQSCTGAGRKEAAGSGGGADRLELRFSPKVTLVVMTNLIVR
jgi:hypothetical protein